jgi:hypothetical protein
LLPGLAITLGGVGAARPRPRERERGGIGDRREQQPVLACERQLAALLAERQESAEATASDPTGAGPGLERR